MHYLIPPIAIKPLSRPKTSWASKTSNVPTSIPSSRVRPLTTTSRCPSPPQSSWTWTVSISLGLLSQGHLLSFCCSFVRSYDCTTFRCPSPPQCKNHFIPRTLIYVFARLKLRTSIIFPLHRRTIVQRKIRSSAHQFEDSFEVENSELFFDLFI